MSNIEPVLQRIISAWPEIEQKLPQIQNEFGQDWIRFIEQINSHCTELTVLKEKVDLLSQNVTDDTANLEDLREEFKQTFNKLLRSFFKSQTLRDILTRPNDNLRHPLSPAHNSTPDELHKAIMKVHAIANEFTLFDKTRPDKNEDHPPKGQSGKQKNIKDD
jgi:hypothetical protein